MGKVRGHTKEQGTARQAPSSPEVVTAGVPLGDGDAGSVPSAWERLRSRELAVKVFVAGATYVVLIKFTNTLGAIVGVMLSPIVSDLIRDYVERHHWSPRRLRRGSAAVAVIGHEEEAYAARRRPGRGPGGGIPGALMASVAAVALVTAGVAAARLGGVDGSHVRGGIGSTSTNPGAVQRVAGLAGMSPTSRPPVLRWHAVPGARRYVVFRDGVRVESRTGLRFVDTMVAPGRYTYQVAAEAHGRMGHRSRPYTIAFVASTLPPATTPTILSPTGLEARGPTTDPPSLVWATVDHVEQYGVYRDGAFVQTVPTAEFVDRAAPPGSHVYTVTAWVSGIQSRPSKPLSVDYSPLLPAPVLTGDSPTTHPPRFSWTDVPGAAKGYAVYRGGIEITTTMNHAYAEKVPLGTYTYTVRAIGADGIEGKVSDGLVIDYVAPPPPPPPIP
ncbi:MAG: hypothetical protein ACRDQC_03495 [Gaiellales bacterium]